MGEPFIASTIHNDMTGTVAADREQGSPFRDLAQQVILESGYEVVGFGLSSLSPLENGKIPFCLFAVDTSKVGCMEAEWKAYAHEHGKLPVERFDSEIVPSEFRGIFKQFKLRLLVDGIGVPPEQLIIED